MSANELNQSNIIYIILIIYLSPVKFDIKTVSFFNTDVLFVFVFFPYYVEILNQLSHFIIIKIKVIFGKIASFNTRWFDKSTILRRTFKISFAAHTNKKKLITITPKRVHNSWFCRDTEKKKIRGIWDFTSLDEKKH